MSSICVRPRSLGKLRLNIGNEVYDVDDGSSFGGSTKTPFASFVRHWNALQSAYRTFKVGMGTPLASPSFNGSPTRFSYSMKFPCQISITFTKMNGGGKGLPSVRLPACSALDIILAGQPQS